MSIRFNPGSFGKTARINSGNQSVQKSGDTFLKKTQGPARTDAAQERADAAISRQELMSLASDFKNGLIDRDEANNRFVEAVVTNSIEGKLSSKDRERIANDIAEFFSQDQGFMRDLEKNLNQLT